MPRSNIIKIWGFLLVNQIIYITVFTSYFPEALLGFILIHCFTFFFVTNVPRCIPEHIQIRKGMKILLFAIFFISFTSKFHSRIDEFWLFINHGYFIMRQLEGEATPILQSAINILFFPSAIALLFSDIKTNFYRRLIYALIIWLILLDLVILGTRNVPAFIVGLFIVLKMNISTRKSYKYLIFFIFSIIAFGLTTKHRTQEAFEGVFDWAYLIKWTVSSQVVQPRVDLMSDLASIVGDWIWPLLFLMQYVSHSVAELSFQILNGNYSLLPSFVYLADQVCLIGCSAHVEDAIFEINNRAGSYQTFLSSVFFDFGTLFVIVAIALVIIIQVTMSIYRRTFKISWSISIFLSYILCLSPIENFFYNGLGMVQVLLSIAFLLVFLVEGSDENFTCGKPVCSNGVL